MGTHLRELTESSSTNTNMTGFRLFSKVYAPCALDESSLSIGRVNSIQPYIEKDHSGNRAGPQNGDP